MELRVLRYFVTVCEAGTLHTAAGTLHVAQPSLSRQIRSLERQLGFDLFDRTPRGLTPTPAGRAFRDVAEDLLNRADQAEAAARSIAKGSVTDLTVVAASTTISDIVAPFVAFAPGGRLIGNAKGATPEQVYVTLTSGQADMAIGTNAPPDSLESVIVGRAYVWAMLSPQHPLADNEHIPVEELVNHPLALMHSGHRVREVFDAALQETGLSTPVALETSVPALAQGIAAAQRGIAVLSDDPLFGLRTIPITTAGLPLMLTLYGVWDPAHYAAAAIESCLLEISAFSQQHGADIVSAPTSNFRGLAPASVAHSVLNPSATAPR